MKLHIILLAALSLATVTSPAAKTKQQKSVLDLKTSITDSSILFPESFETNTQRLLDGWYMKNYSSYDSEAADPGNPSVSDDEMRSRLANLPTVIELPFNQIVRQYIDRYLEKSRPQVSAILGLNNYYSPIFEQALEERGLPLELKYLPVIESGLDPNAVSRHGAAGLWQFMLATAKGLGMEVNSLVDERRDPYIASEAAADYLKSLHDTYSDWSLAIAAYNCGPGQINKAIRRAGGESSNHDFWSIYEYLQPETRGYFPMFIAANYVMNYYPEHAISPVLPTKPLVTDTIHVSDRVHFNQISAVLDIPVEELRLLNPQYRADLIPGNGEKSYNLILPSQQVQAYLVSHDEILAYEAEKYSRREDAEPGDPAPESMEPEIVTAQLPVASRPEVAMSDVTETLATTPEPTYTANGGSKMVSHKVKQGETLASIAKQYGVTSADIRAWNHLRRNAVRTGQTLKIHSSQTEQTAAVAPAPKQQPSAKSETAAVSKKNQQTSSQNSKKAKSTPQKPKTTDHQIVSGESLTSISKKYGVSIDEIKAANGMKSDDLRAGNSIKIPSKGKTTGGSSKSKKSKSKKSKKRR